ncbi:hypothetical protein N7522_001700 [Penicillium canescens]|uniref:Uncharacterized protein n=1 Tax=Penicillium canescens TaxID=5083 RepID=A0AAD6IQH6_PENCN|nr:uncharacterized protein N7446_008575 [Penicillium canescens]KAJ6019633.1 hypothetical protein N7522_001700 [Penicillium canescens]KAJ6033132.1 hypothetical protein N7444_010903 [Penicillium canescens]KAJ6057678.1 hypothetical protein N7460_000952 [Penicillium canescens]KAJ6058992.1 hypothetical protein N7446_008575 [Penicillium canescens]
MGIDDRRCRRVLDDSSGSYQTLAPGLEAQAEQYARISYRNCVGEEQSFDETYGKLSMRPDGLLATAK